MSLRQRESVGFALHGFLWEPRVTTTPPAASAKRMEKADLPQTHVQQAYTCTDPCSHELSAQAYAQLCPVPPVRPTDHYCYAQQTYSLTQEIIILLMAQGLRNPSIACGTFRGMSEVYRKAQDSIACGTFHSMAEGVSFNTVTRSNHSPHGWSHTWSFHYGIACGISIA